MTQVNWIGGSGKSYPHEVHSWPPRLLGLGISGSGNYIFVRRVPDGWVPIYIGQGDFSERLTTNHHKYDCISRKGATEVHVMVNPNEQDRLAVESDLLRKYTGAYSPTGCNEKTGG